MLAKKLKKRVLADVKARQKAQKVQKAFSREWAKAI